MLIANTRFLEQHHDAVTSFLEVYVQAIRRLTDGKLKNDQQVFFMANNSVDCTQPMDMEKLIDYGPLDSALKTIGE